MRKITTLWAIGGLVWGLSATAWTQTATFTPNLTLTPPCSPAGSLGNSAIGSVHGSASDTMRGSIYTLSSPATVYSLTVYCDSPPINMQIMTGIYSGSTGDVGNLIVQSAAQVVTNGWNAFSVLPTYLAPGTYWLLYQPDDSGYNVTYTNSASPNIEAFTTYSISFSNMPNTMPTPGYGTGQESIYALYCLVPTNTATNTDTPTITATPTDTFTATITNTATNTGTIFTNTPSSTFTSTPTLTPTVTITFTPSVTPNLSLTPSCGGSFASFGDSTTTGAPVTASSSIEMRACRYTLPADSTVQTMSLFATNYSAGSIAEVALYSNTAATTTMGNLIAQSVTQTLTAGWNVFQVPSSPVTAGDYWLAYIFDAPVSYSLVNQTSPAAVNTLAFTTTVASWIFDSTGSGYSPTYAPNWYEPILANYCPGLIATNTVTNTVTITGTSTVTNTATNTATATISSTSTNTPTTTVTDTATNTATITISPTWSMTFTNTPSPTITLTPTDTFTSTVSDTVTNSPTGTSTLSPTASYTNTATNTVTNTFTDTPTSTWSMTFTNTPTLTPSPTITDTPIFSYTPSPTFTLTDTLTITLTPTNTLTNTSTSTATNTVTNSATNTATSTSTSTFSSTFTPTLTNTITNTGTITQTFTFTMTPTFTATNSPTPHTTLTNTPTSTCTPTPAAINVLSMFPNPVQGTAGVNLQVFFNEPHDYVEIKVYTLAFRKIYDDQVNYVSAGQFNYSVDPSKFKGSASIANGLYYVIVTTPTNRWMLKLLVLR